MSLNIFQDCLQGYRIQAYNINTDLPNSQKVVPLIDLYRKAQQFIQAHYQFNSIQFNLFVIYGHRPKIHTIQYNNI